VTPAQRGGENAASRRHDHAVGHRQSVPNADRGRRQCSGWREFDDPTLLHGGNPLQGSLFTGFSAEDLEDFVDRDCRNDQRIGTEQWRLEGRSVFPAGKKFQPAR